MESFFSGLEALPTPLTYKGFSSLVSKTCNDQRIKREDCMDWAKAFGVRRRYRSKKELLTMTGLMWMLHDSETDVPETLRLNLLQSPEIPILEAAFVEGVFTSKQRTVFRAVLTRLRVRLFASLLKRWLPFPIRNRTMLLECLCIFWFRESSSSATTTSVRPHPSRKRHHHALLPCSFSSSHEEECAICMEDFSQNQQQCFRIKTCPCRMVYHHHCATQWLNRHGTCPTCRKLVV